jgi:hypothetical protein
MDDAPSLTDLDTRGTDAPEPKPKRKRGRPKLRPRPVKPRLAAAPPVEATSPFEGLSALPSCAAACRQGHCVITHDEICGHPAQGLQPKHALIPDVVERRRQAMQYLAIKKAEKRYA